MDNERYRWKIIYLRGESNFDKWRDFHDPSEIGVGLSYTYKRQDIEIDSDTMQGALSILQEICGSSAIVAPINIMNQGEVIALTSDPQIWADITCCATFTSTLPDRNIMNQGETT